MGEIWTQRHREERPCKDTGRRCPCEYHDVSRRQHAPKAGKGKEGFSHGTVRESLALPTL